MQEKPPFRELIIRAKAGDDESFVLIVQRLNPIVQKYARWLDDSEAYSDLVLWIANAIVRYRPPMDKPDS